MTTEPPTPEDVPRDPVGQVVMHEGRSLAVVDLGREASEALRASWSEDGERPSESGGIIESAWLQPLIGAGSTAASSLFAGNVFLATTNPATLMTIGSGVGSAVMGPAGIVAQAPFVAASSALMPVLAPVMLFTTLSSLTMCARLDRTQKQLGQLSEVVERVRHLLEAEDYARFEAAAERIDEIRSEYGQCQRFASDVPARLAKIDHDVGVLRSKYGVLATGAVHSEKDAKQMARGVSQFFLANLYDVQIDVLQLYLALQNDPEVVDSRRSRLFEKVERYGDDFRRVLDADPVGDYHRELKRALPKRALSKPALSKLPPAMRREAIAKLPSLLKEEAAARLRSFVKREAVAEVGRIRQIRNNLRATRTHMERWIEAFEEAEDGSRPHSIVFYRESDGERPLRAYRTASLSVERSPVDATRASPRT